MQNGNFPGWFRRAQEAIAEPPTRIELAETCPSCGAAIVAEPKAADPLIAPDAVLPVKVTKSAAQAEVRRWLATRWFAPTALKRIAEPEGHVER